MKTQFLLFMGDVCVGITAETVEVLGTLSVYRSDKSTLWELPCTVALHLVQY